MIYRYERIRNKRPSGIKSDALTISATGIFDGRGMQDCTNLKTIATNLAVSNSLKDLNWWTVSQPVEKKLSWII